MPPRRLWGRENHWKTIRQPLKSFENHWKTSRFTAKLPWKGDFKWPGGAGDGEPLPLRALLPPRARLEDLGLPFMILSTIYHIIELVLTIRFIHRHHRYDQVFT